MIAVCVIFHDIIFNRDYHFLDKASMLAGKKAKDFLETAKVTCPSDGQMYWYGTSISTVRKVAAVGKLCLMGLDLQGAKVRTGKKKHKPLLLWCT